MDIGRFELPWDELEPLTNKEASDREQALWRAWAFVRISPFAFRLAHAAPEDTEALLADLRAVCAALNAEKDRYQAEAREWFASRKRRQKAENTARMLAENAARSKGHRNRGDTQAQTERRLERRRQEAEALGTEPKALQRHIREARIREAAQVIRAVVRPVPAPPVPKGPVFLPFCAVVRCWRCWHPILFGDGYWDPKDCGRLGVVCARCAERIGAYGRSVSGSVVVEVGGARRAA